MEELASNTSLEPLLQEGDEESDGGSSHLTEKTPRSLLSSSSSYRPSSFWIAIANVLLFVSSIIILGFAKREFSGQSSACTKANSFYSPALDEVRYEKVRFAGLQTPDSKFRGPPSPLIDEAWDNVTWRIPELPVGEDVVHQAKIPFDINSMTRFPPDYGGQIYTEVEWKHHLHCLNLMRKYLFYDYYYDSTVLFYAHTAEEITNHLAHCVDMLRQFVMCNADTGVVFSYWVEGLDHIHVDFNTEHICRDFERLVDFQMQNGIRINQDLLARHPGTIDLPDHPENLTLAMMKPEERNKYFL